MVAGVGLTAVGQERKFSSEVAGVQRAVKRVKHSPPTGVDSHLQLLDDGADPLRGRASVKSKFVKLPTIFVIREPQK
ncbi:hypothetical protein D2E51_14660 [Mycobacteroides abscessus]|nr:hypothetical protein MM1S1510930_5788 [Mycobacteroides abscessus subsp. bolletii 1S-151-0930]EIU82800.1 hypothetical protein MM1S1530915_0343 [Mycobacteroides abscessus subsp. bolletii 1S-153-0915]MBE5479456.1 hypothetical protein [Mycobacteroides abscessus]SKI32244.1 Uncharacterised protein [Mycobacteroides abscessus subsp. massiliense]PVA69362.1 hypothetical protein DDJ87_01960 [Mycobacteroides abscessus]